jgi:hypothetical protein
MAAESSAGVRGEELPDDLRGVQGRVGRVGVQQPLGQPVRGGARLICLTPRGRAALRAMRSSARAIEDEWRERLGAERLAGFRDTLTTLLSAAS